MEIIKDISVCSKSYTEFKPNRLNFKDESIIRHSLELLLFDSNTKRRYKIYISYDVDLEEKYDHHLYKITFYYFDGEYKQVWFVDNSKPYIRTESNIAPEPDKPLTTEKLLFKFAAVALLNLKANNLISYGDS